MFNPCTNQHVKLGSLPFISGEGKIPANETSYTIDTSKLCPPGIEGALISDMGTATLPYSYTESEENVTVHAPSFVIDKTGAIVARSTEARFKYLIIGKR